ncbi:IGR protein motif-domain-containing protein [Gilbertella persicaria]|uniref:IGR protein motif-domain-containing protein n=1 Tax=Gilbertella persicaria TaxID=101096 RepID=UPI0022202ED8|nr:IGR protein motif-domain-containing protein [Gilbertella persicaria]KAI8080728.1 IGR protein motif-domain-containing protein [Gilbertella persicaria]
MMSMLRSCLIRGVRYSHSSAATHSVPSVRGNIQDVESFMKAIGRNCEEVAGKFESWEQLFTTNSRIMKNDMGISTKQRKYILSWSERYRKGVEPYAISVPKKK